MRPPLFLISARDDLTFWLARQSPARRAMMGGLGVVTTIIASIQIFGDAGAAHSAVRMAIDSDVKVERVAELPTEPSRSDEPLDAQPQMASTEASKDTPNAAPPVDPFADEPFQGFVERGPGGYLPVIRMDGATAATTWTRPARTDPGPKVALVVRGLGLSETHTRYAIERLPKDVTLAFSPYAPNPQPLVDAARAAGFEIMIDAPAEPFDYPQTDPGPHTLLTNVAVHENRRRLEWVMSRMAGYFGVLLCGGERFLTRGDSARATALQISDRGVGVLTCGDGVEREFGAFAGAPTAPYGHADVVGARAESAERFDRYLLQVEIRALEKQAAIGVVTITPMAVDVIARWSETLPLGGYVLAPASQVMADQQALRENATGGDGLTRETSRPIHYQTVEATFNDRDPPAAGDYSKGK